MRPFDKTVSKCIFWAVFLELTQQWQWQKIVMIMFLMHGHNKTYTNTTLYEGTYLYTQIHTVTAASPRLSTVASHLLY